MIVARFGPAAAAWGTSAGALMLSVAFATTALRSFPASGPELLKAIPAALLPALFAAAAVLISETYLSPPGVAKIIVPLLFGAAAWCTLTFAYRRRIATLLHSLQPEELAKVTS
jgi:hypothetical protein